MSVGKTGGLNWFGVGRVGGQDSTGVDRILNKRKVARHDEARRAPHVGSASIVSADDWLATAEANREARERDGAVGNPFSSAEALVQESQRQKTSSSTEFVMAPSEPDEPRWDSLAICPGLYA